MLLYKNCISYFKKAKKPDFIMTKHLFYLHLIFLWVLISCKPIPIPSQLSITKEDQQSVENPPTKEELILSRNDLAILRIPQKGISQIEIDNTLKIITRSFNKEANFQVIPNQKVKRMIAKPSYRNFDSKNVIDAIELAEALNATYVAQVYFEKIEDERTHSINITVFKVDTRQTVLKEEMIVDPLYSEKFYEQFKVIVQKYFPLQGFILETRGNRQVAKISLGRSVGIEAGRKLIVYNRIITGNIQGNNTSEGLGVQRIQYSEKVATVKVIEVMENESWVLINSSDSDRIRLGQVVFTLPR